MESRNGQVRLLPSTDGPAWDGGATRFIPYVYRGTGYDTMPDAITSDGSTDYVTGSTPGRRPVRYANRCQTCGYGYRSRAHRLNCR